MTTNISFATTDGYLRCTSTNYATCRDGGGTLTVDTGGMAIAWGQAFTAGTTYWNYQGFLSFTYSVAATDVVSAARFVVRGTGDFSTGLDRSLEVREYDWGASLDTGDWRTSGWWGGVSPLARVYRAQATNGRLMSAGSDALVTRMVSGSSPLRVVCASDRQSAGITPTGQEDSTFGSVELSGTDLDPRLTWFSTTRSTHSVVGGAQVRLAGGGWAYLDSDGAATPTITLYHHDGSTATAIGVLPTGSSSTDFARPQGYQGITLCRDDADNIYVIGAQGSNPGAIAARVYVKGGGAIWTPGALRSAALAQFLDAGINNVSAGWHNVGTSGTIMALASHSAGRWNLNPTNDTRYALLNCQYLLTGSGSLLRNSGTAVGSLLPAVSSSTDYSPMCNPTGTGLDVQVPPSAGTRGYVCGFSGQSNWAENGANYPCRYILAPDGSSLTAAVYTIWSAAWAVKEATTKIRTLAISDTMWATVSADEDAGYGLTIQVEQNVGTSTTITHLGTVLLDGIDATMPAAATIAVSQGWDAVYDPSEHKVWVYYIDATAPRTLCRTSVDLDTYLSTGDVVEVDTALGTGAGSVCRSVRVERCARAGSSAILVSCAIDTSGTLTTDLIVDDFNVSPTAPLLTTTSNFDADADHTFEWTFVDPNSGDSQSSFQLDINTAAGANVYDTGRLTGDLSLDYGATGAYDSDGDGGPLTPDMPTDWQEGDLLLLLAASRESTDTLTPPAGWSALVDDGNVVLLGRIARAGDIAPTIQFDSATTGDDVFAQMARVYGTDQDISAVVHASATQSNASAQDIATPALTVTTDNCMILWVGWKQDDWTSSSEPSTSTEIDDVPLTAGDDMGVTWAYDYQSTATNVAADTFAITGGAAAISTAMTVALRPYQAPTAESFTLLASVIANEGTYQWRVRTWDVGDLVSPWSDYESVQTSASGTVTITDPATDNPGDIETSTTTVSWSVADTTQVDYRVVVTRTDTSAELVDTGWVTGTETSYTIIDLISDIEYQVSVTVRDGALVESGAGLRLLTATYGAPETPTIVATPYPDAGYVQVTVTNPPSLEDVAGAPLYDYESGVAEMTVSGGAVAQSSAYAYSGTFAAEMTVSGSPAEMTMRAPLVAVLPTEQYLLTYQAYSVSGYTDLADAIDWYDSASGYLSTSAQTEALASGAWSLRSWLATAPVSAAYATYGPTLDASPSAGTVLYVDDLLIQLRTDRPDPAGNALHRRRADGTGAIVVVATADEVGVDGTFWDYTAAAQTSYQYRARATATDGTSDSDWSDAVTLALGGVWLHDPLDPDGTVLQVPYGSASRATARDVSTSVLQMAGRTYPIIEFGEPETQVYTIRAMVAHGPTWAEDLEDLVWFVRAKRPIVVRDNRGRMAYAMLSGYREDDADEGTNVSFTASRMDYSESTVEH